MDKRENIIGNVFVSTESQLIDMGDPTEDTVFRVHTHQLTKGECMPPSGPDFASAVTDAYNAKRKVWQVVIASDGYYLFRVLDKKLNEFASFIDALSSTPPSLQERIDHAVKQTCLPSYADSQIVVHEIMAAAVDAATAKATTIWLKEHDTAYNQITYEACHRDGDRSKYLYEIAKRDEFEIHFYKHGNSICYSNRCDMHGRSRTLD